MPLSLRTHRAQVFSYADVGTQGAVDSVYVPVLPPDGSNSWWCSKGFAGSGESTVASSAQHSRQGVFVFAAECPMGVDYALIIDGLTYVVRSVTPAEYGTDENIVTAEHVAHMTLTNT